MASIFTELMRRATQPILPQISQGWDLLADQVNDPNSGSANVPLQTVKGAIAGSMQGLGRVAAGATSPLGILATMAGAGPLSRMANSAKYAHAAEGVTPSLPPEFLPVGAEPTPLPVSRPNPMDAVYSRLLAKGGR